MISDMLPPKDRAPSPSPVYISTPTPTIQLDDQSLRPILGHAPETAVVRFNDRDPVSEYRTGSVIAPGLDLDLDPTRALNQFRCFHILYYASRPTHCQEKR